MENGVKSNGDAKSPTLVENNEMETEEVDVKDDEPFISRSMEEEEIQLLETRVKEEEEESKHEADEAPKLHESQFSKLDELLTQTQLYSEFLLEKMDDITLKKAKRAVAAVLTRSKESETAEDMDLAEEERIDKEQKELIFLWTGVKLKQYQMKGVKWLISLWQNGLNGILADQMGLGKTIQTTGFLAHLKGKGLDGPNLIIASLSTLSNWMSEISR